MLRVEGSFVSVLGSRPYVEELGSQQSWNRNISAPGRGGGDGLPELWKANLLRWG